MKKAVFFSLLFVNSLLFASESIESLLSGYIKNSISLLNLFNEVESKSLDYKIDRISNSYSMELSTGNMTCSFGDEFSCSINPSASLKIPQANNLEFSVSSDMDFSASDSEFSNTSLNFSVDVFSDNARMLKIDKAMSERELLLAKRNLQNGFLEVETEFYKELKSLYELAAEIESAQKTLFEDKLEFEKVNVQGFSKTSTKYQLAQMEVLSSEHNVELLEHELNREIKIFASKCGKQFNGSDVWEFLPSSIRDVPALDISDFEEKDFSKIESVKWSNFINEEIRNADKNFSVKANGGYTFGNDLSGKEKKDTLDLGSAITWNDSGLTANFGVSLPVDNFTPIYKFGLSVNPNQFRINALKKQQEAYIENNEELAEESAVQDFITTVISQKTSLKNILWNKEKLIETYNLYSSLEKDMKIYFDKGVISESEYRTAQVNKENYRIKCLISNIDLIIYNNQLKLLFVRDQEIK